MNRGALAGARRGPQIEREHVRFRGGILLDTEEHPQFIQGAKAFLSIDIAPDDIEPNGIQLRNQRGARPPNSDYGEAQLLVWLNNGQAPTQDNISVFGAVTGATNASPIVVTVPSRTFNVTTVNASNQITAAGAYFSAEDIGAAITTAGNTPIPAGTTITDVKRDGSGRGTTATISQNAIASTTAAATVADHGLTTGDICRLTGLVGNTAPNNQWWRIDRLTRTTFSLRNSTGNGAYTSGGWMFCNKSPVMGRIDDDGSLGLATGVHIAMGLRGQENVAWAGSGATLNVERTIDMHGIAIQNPDLTQWQGTPTGAYIYCGDRRGASGSRIPWQIDANGVMQMRPQEGRALSDPLARIVNDAGTTEMWSVDQMGLIRTRGLHDFARLGLVNSVQGSNTAYADSIAAPTLTATAANADDANQSWVKHTTTTVSGNPSGIISAAFNLVRPGWLPRFACLIRTGPAVASFRYVIGLVSANPDTLPGTLHGAWFRCDLPAGDTGWRTYTGAGGTPTAGAQTTALANSTVYKLEIVFVGARGGNPTNVLFFINEALVANHTATLPAANQQLGWAIRVVTLAVATRELDWSWVNLFSA